MEPKKGITRLEIIVVVAIVVVLAVILFPVFEKARSPIHYPSCQQQMKELAVALQIYANDYDGLLPSSALVSGSEEWNKKDFLTFATKVGDLPPGPGTVCRTWPQVLYHHLRNKDAMFCPSDPTFKTNRGVTPSPGAEISYWWKLAVDKAWYGEDCSKEYRRLDDYPRNADCIILYEHMGWHFGSTEGLTNGAQINCAFLDSHVKSHMIQNATSGDPINCAANSDGSPMYFNFDNDQALGPDNPPAPSVPATYVDPGRYSDRLP